MENLLLDSNHSDHVLRDGLVDKQRFSFKQIKDNDSGVTIMALVKLFYKSVCCASLIFTAGHLLDAKWI